MDASTYSTTIKKMNRRIIPFIMLLYLIAYIDRSNISIAALQMNADLALSAEMYGIAAGIFYISYIIFATPLALADHCDFLLICTNGGAQTRALVDAQVLAALGREGILINIARGSVVDEAALVTAIDQGTIAGAGLDVFECEPQVPAALMGRDNVVLTPHMASATHCTRRMMVDLVFDNVAAYFAGHPLPTPVVESPNE